MPDPGRILLVSNRLPIIVRWDGDATVIELRSHGGHKGRTVSEGAFTSRVGNAPTSRPPHPLPQRAHP